MAATQSKPPPLSSLPPNAKHIHKNLIPSEVRKNFPKKSPHHSINSTQLTRRFAIFILMQPRRAIPIQPQPLSNLDGQSLAEVLVMCDYYPFGLEMPGQVYVASEYRYGFNGMERDDEVKETGDSHDFGARMYDPRVGRWWSLDPMEKNYPCISGFAFVGNMPISMIDPTGKSGEIAVFKENGKITITLTTTLFVAANADQATVSAMQQSVNKYLNSKSVAYDENTTIKFEVTVKSISDADSRMIDGRDNYAQITEGRSHAGLVSMSYERIDLDRNVADIIAVPGQNMFLDPADANDPRSVTTSHEILHKFGLLDRYIDLLGVSLPDPNAIFPDPNPDAAKAGFKAFDIMANGSEMLNKNYFRGVVELAYKNLGEGNSTTFKINPDSPGVMNYDVQNVKEKQAQGKLPEQ